MVARQQKPNRRQASTDCALGKRESSALWCHRHSRARFLPTLGRRRHRDYFHYLNCHASPFFLKLHFFILSLQLSRCHAVLPRPCTPPLGRCIVSLQQPYWCPTNLTLRP